MNTLRKHSSSLLKAPISFAVLFLIIHTTAFAQPAIQWQRCLGGTTIDQGYDIIQTSDSGYAIAGFVNSSDGDCPDNHGFFNSDVFVARLDPQGKTIWKECLGGTNTDQAYSIIQTTDGGFIIAGSTLSKDGDVSGYHQNASYPYADAWIVKLDGNGKKQWQHCYGGTGEDRAYSIIQTTDGGYAFAGYTGSIDGDVKGGHGYEDYWIVKLDPSGTIEWQKCLGGSQSDYATSIIQTSDKGYAITGESDSHDGDVTNNHNIGGPSSDVWVVKLDAAGSIQWQRCFGGNWTDESKQIIETSDGGYAIAALTYSSDGDVTGFHPPTPPAMWDVWILRLDGNGNLLWEKCFGGTGSEEGMSLVQTADGGFVFTGCIESSDGDAANRVHYGEDEIWLVKIDSSGIIEWKKILGGSHVDFANRVIHTFDNGYALIGWTESNDHDVSGNHNEFVNDIWVVKLGCSGTSIYLKNTTINPHPGDSVGIPIYMKSTNGTIRLSGVISETLNFSMNTDLVTPVRFISAIPGLQLSSLTINGQNVTVSLLDTIGFSITGETLIGYLRCATYITDTLQTSVILTDESIAFSKNLNCLSLVATTDTILISMANECGESTLSRYMKYDSTFKILSIVPNPAGNKVSIILRNSGSIVQYEILDVLGKNVKHGVGKGNSLTLEVSDVPSGKYFLHLTSSMGIEETESLVIMR